MRRLRNIALAVALMTGLATARAAAGQADDVPKLFGARVQADTRFQAPFATGDFEGDGRQDALYLVTILPGSAGGGIARDVTVIDGLFGEQPLGTRPEKLALAIVQEGGRRKFLFTGYQGEGVADYFDSPVWQQSPVPIQTATRGSKTFEDFQRQDRKIKNDFIVVGTEAGIDTALFWSGSGYVLFQPAEEP